MIKQSLVCTQQFLLTPLSCGENLTQLLLFRFAKGAAVGELHNNLCHFNSLEILWMSDGMRDFWKVLGFCISSLHVLLLEGAFFHLFGL